MRRTISFPIALVVLMATGCESETEEAPVLRPVRYLVVQSSDAARQRTFSGVAKAGQESRLSFQVTGRVLEVPVKVGDRVKKGQSIARIDPADYQLQLANSRAAAAQARAQERNAKAVYERTRALYENQNASRQDLDADRTSYESARAALSSAQQGVSLYQRQLGYTHLKAPGAGTISTVDVEANENVNSGRLVATLQVGEQIEVSVAVPGSVIRKVTRGDAVQARFDALGGKELKGIVSEVGVASVRGGATFPVTVRLTEGEDPVRAGMSADVTFEFSREETGGYFVLPAAAVGEDRDGRFVFTLEQKGEDRGIVHRRPVVVDSLTSEGIEIKEGIEPGDLVVTAGVSVIYDGLEVRVPPASPSSPTTTGQSEETIAPAEEP